MTFELKIEHISMRRNLQITSRAEIIGLAINESVTNTGCTIPQRKKSVTIILMRQKSFRPYSPKFK